MSISKHKERFQLRAIIAVSFKVQIHDIIFKSHLFLDIDIPPLTANRHGHQKTIGLSEQLPSYAYTQFKCTRFIMCHARDASVSISFSMCRIAFTSGKRKASHIGLFSDNQSIAAASQATWPIQFVCCHGTYLQTIRSKCVCNDYCTRTRLV